MTQTNTDKDEMEEVVDEEDPVEGEGVEEGEGEEEDPDTVRDLLSTLLSTHSVWLRM